MSTFYDNYIKLCASCGKKPTTVSKEIGLSNAAATGWKNGKKPSAITKQRLADYFGISVSELTGEEQKEKLSTPEDAELESHGQAILDKYNMLDPATQAMFESMLDAAIAAQEKKNGQ